MPAKTEMTAARLRAEMKARDWSAADLASRVGCSTPSIYYWLSGSGKPKKAFAEKIAAVFATPSNGHDAQPAAPEPQSSQPQDMAVVRCLIGADGFWRIKLEADSVNFDATQLSWDTAREILRGLARNGHRIELTFSDRALVDGVVPADRGMRVGGAAHKPL